MAGMGHERHLDKGSSEPPAPEKDVLRVYSMKFCPFAQRLKLVLAARGIKHETVNVDLAKKPDWYFEKNPRGLVPTIEINGQIIYESDITSEYADAVYPGKKILTTNPLRKAKEQILLGDHGKTISGFYGTLLATDKEKRQEASKKLFEGLGSLEKYLVATKAPFVCGDQPGFTDYMMWPHLERIHIFSEKAFEGFPNVQGYIAKMCEDAAVKACRLPNEWHTQFADSYKKKEPKYDIGTVKEYKF